MRAKTIFNTNPNSVDQNGVHISLNIDFDEARMKTASVASVVYEKHPEIFFLKPPEIPRLHSYRIVSIDLYSASLRITIQRRSQHENPGGKETSLKNERPMRRNQSLV